VAPLPSERRFGVFFAAVFALATLYALFVSARPVVVALCAVASLGFGLLALARPTALRPLNRAWATLGHWLGRIVSPIVLGVIFFLLITPVALLTRLFGRDELRLRRGAGTSYWIARDPVGPAPESFRDQY
jgi:hypothetical protein